MTVGILRVYNGISNLLGIHMYNLKSVSRTQNYLGSTYTIKSPVTCENNQKSLIEAIGIEIILDNIPYPIKRFNLSKSTGIIEIGSLLSLLVGPRKDYKESGFNIKNREKYAQRADVITELFTVKNMTCKEIGKELQISGVRVAQILDTYGVCREEGGVKLRTLRNKEKALSIKDKKTRKAYGCTFTDYNKIRGDTKGENSPITAYRYKKRNVTDIEGGEWDLTLTEWWGIWRKAGGWELRGVKAEDLRMLRKDPEKPYMKDNVFITCL